MHGRSKYRWWPADCERHLIEEEAQLPGCVKKAWLNSDWK
jgi:hypothetical protein